MDGSGYRMLLHSWAPMVDAMEFRKSEGAGRDPYSVGVRITERAWMVVWPRISAELAICLAPVASRDDRQVALARLKIVAKAAAVLAGRNHNYILFDQDVLREWVELAAKVVSQKCDHVDLVIELDRAESMEQVDSILAEARTMLRMADVPFRCHTAVGLLA